MASELILGWGMLVLSVIFNALGVFAIKWRLNQLGPINFESFQSTLSYFFLLLQSPFVLAGVVLFFLAPFLFTVSLSRMEISIAYPAQIGLNFFLVLILAILFLGEQMTFTKLIGIMCVLAGIYFLNKKG